MSLEQEQLIKRDLSGAVHALVIEGVTSLPSRRQDYFRINRVLDRGKYSYLLTLQHGEGVRPFFLLSVEDSVNKGVVEQTDLFIARKKRGDGSVPGYKEELLRVGQLRIGRHDVTESGVSDVRNADNVLHDLLTNNLRNIGPASIHIQRKPAIF